MKFNNKLAASIALAMLMGAALPVVSMADPEPETRLTVGEPTKAEFNPYTVEIPRLYTLDSTANDTVLIRLVNSSSNNHTVFKAPSLQVQGNSFLVPANTTREVVVPKAALGYETRRVDYSVEKIPDPIPPGPQFEDWKNRLAALIAAQRPDYSYFPQYQFNR